MTFTPDLWPSLDAVMSLPVQTETGHTVCVWAMVDPSPDVTKERRRFEVIGTGWEIDDRDRRYIGTAQIIDGSPLVFHVFETLDWRPGDR